jgi:hypothetical protein
LPSAFDLFVTDGFACPGLIGGSIARLVKDLEQVILDYVTDGARLVIEGAAPLNPKSSAMVICTLSTWVAAPERLQERVRRSGKKSMLCTGRLPR